MTIPFRDAHEIVGRAVKRAIDANTDLADLPVETLKALHYGIEKDVVEALTLEVSVAARDHLGGTAPAQVNAAVARGRARLAG